MLANCPYPWGKETSVFVRGGCFAAWSVTLAVGAYPPHPRRAWGAGSVDTHIKKRRLPSRVLGKALLGDKAGQRPIRLLKDKHLKGAEESTSSLK